MTTESYKPKIREILVWPDPRLNIRATDVVNFDDNLRNLIADMFVTMTANEGVGLAAPQIAEPYNIIAIRLEPTKLLTLINPTIMKSSDDNFEWEEGCLSVPGYFENRKRPNTIEISFYDPSGEEVTAEFSGLYAFAIQHELDHLNGKVFVDGSSWLKESRIKKKIKKTLKQRDAEIEKLRQRLKFFK
jgi:peptide deformylase